MSANHVIAEKSGKAGIITLNRPEAINALTLQMIEAIAGAMEAFVADPGVAAILLEANGPRGFCAGGDVRAVREQVLKGDFSGAEAFFRAEYGLNGAIAACAKPLIALTDGVVMGGGIGLAGHARFRIATARARFAMPEGAIGFFPDVGVNAILAKAPRERALAFLMTGMTVGASDAFALGLTDCIVPENGLAAVKSDLLNAIRGFDIETGIVAVMQKHSVQAGDAQFAAAADRFAAIFAGDEPAAIADGLREASKGDETAREWSETIATRCPASMAVAVLAQLAARKHRDIHRVLAADLKLAEMMVKRPDFAEGVRAVLIDKDRNAHWQPGRIADVDLESIYSRL